MQTAAPMTNRPLVPAPPPAFVPAASPAPVPHPSRSSLARTFLCPAAR